MVTFPDFEAEFRSRNEVYKMGLLRVEHLPAVPIETALSLDQSTRASSMSPRITGSGG
jgi:hypothetical protein